MSVRHNVEQHLEQLFWQEMMTGADLFCYSEGNPLILRSVSSTYRTVLHSRPYHIDHLSRTVLEYSPTLALAAFNLHYRQFSYASTVLPFHFLYARVFRLIHGIKESTPREFFELVTGLDLDSLSSSLTAFLEEVSPLCTAYIARLFQLSQPSSSSSGNSPRLRLVQNLYTYPVTYTKSAHHLYHRLLGCIMHFLRQKHWQPTIPLTISTPRLMRRHSPLLSMTIPLPNRIMILLSPQTVPTHAAALQKITFFSHEIGHALHFERLMDHHYPLYQFDSTHLEIPALLFENFFSDPLITSRNGLSQVIAEEIAFYTHFTLLLRCIREVGRTLTLLDCFRLPHFTRTAFTPLVHTYSRTLSRVMGYPVTIPPMLNPYSIFYDLESVLGHWVTGTLTIDLVRDLADPIPITDDYRPFLAKKWAFLTSLDE